MPRRFLAAVVLAPALISSAFSAQAGDRCDAIRARINQMPEIIGSGTAVRMKAESEFRLGRIEQDIRRDMRRLDCPSASVVYWDAENEQACTRLGEELHQVQLDRQSFRDLQPVLSQKVDDGSGLLPVLIRQMKAAGCTSGGGMEDNVEIITSQGDVPDVQQANLATEIYPASGEDAQDSAYLTDENAVQPGEQLATSLGNGQDAEYGMPANDAMAAVQPDDTTGPNGEPLTQVELPKLDNSGVIQGQGSIDTLRTPVKPAVATAKTYPPVPDRAYDPNDKKVRRIGPAFLAEDEKRIDLTHPADGASAN